MLLRGALRLRRGHGWEGGRLDGWAEHERDAGRFRLVLGIWMMPVQAQGACDGRGFQAAGARKRPR